tara:strand:- start:514 stop:714 length:201 start_codon:yes stop_codon:yes gene_type:complete
MSVLNICVLVDCSVVEDLDENILVKKLLIGSSFANEIVGWNVNIEIKARLVAILLLYVSFKISLLE